MIRYLDANNPIQRVDPELKARLIHAQSNLLHLQFSSAGELCERAISDLRVSCPVPTQLYQLPLAEITNLTYGQLTSSFADILVRSGFPDQSVPLHAVNLAQQLQLIQAFDQPDEVIASIEEKVATVVNRFPRTSSDIERGRNPGDVLDPYILAATQYLMYGGNFERAIEATIAHKALMMIEGLLGHLHEDVIGLMRGNVRAPEPRGEDQETLDPENNPFPGADVIQPPWSETTPLRFHQLKSKTGSAKGGDGRRLGEQLQRLQDLYGGEIYYHALIGNTLQGHRSKAGVERAAPDIVVLVGSASFRELTGSDIGPQLLLRVYQSAFTSVARKFGYVLETLAATIVATFQERATAEGHGFLEVILKGVTDGPEQDQDSRLYNRRRRR